MITRTYVYVHDVATTYLRQQSISIVAIYIDREDTVHIAINCILPTHDP